MPDTYLIVLDRLTDPRESESTTADDHADTQRHSRIGDNYFMLETPNVPDKSEAVPHTQDTQECTNNSDTYFILDKTSTLDKRSIPQEADINNDTYEFAKHMDGEDTDQIDPNTNASDRAGRKAATDQYDHVRVGPARANGIDDDVYDELTKQNILYPYDEIDNDYDHR